VAIDDVRFPLVDRRPDGPMPLKPPRLEALVEPSEKGAPGFFGNIVGHAEQMSFLVNSVKSVYRMAETSLYNDEVPEGWNRFNEEALLQVAPQHWPLVASARSPMQQAKLIERIKADADQAEYLRQGGAVSGLLGSGLAFVGEAIAFAPLAELAVGEKYTAVSGVSGLLKGTFTNLVPSAVFSAAYNAPRLGADTSFSLNDYANNILIEGAFGAILMGLGSGINGAMLAQKAKAVPTLADGIEYKIVTKANGEFDRLMAVRAEGYNLSAAEVDFSQRYADGLIESYKLKPFLQKVTEASPIVRGLESPFGTVRDYTQQFYNTAAIFLKSHGLDIAPTQTVEQTVKGIQGFGLQTVMAVDKHWEKSMGGLSYHKDAQAFVRRKLGENDFYQRGEFYEEVTRAVLNGGKHEPLVGRPHSPDIEAAAMDVRKHLDELHDYAVERGVMRAGEDPNYLPIMYDKNILQVSEREWLDGISQGIMDQSDKIRFYTENYTPEQIQGMIARKEIDPLLVDQPIKLNEVELAQLKELHASMEAIEAKIAATKGAEKAAAKDELNALQRDIFERMEKGAIPESVAFPTGRGKGFVLADLDRLPKLHKAVKSRADAIDIAKSAYDTITHDHPEDLAAQILRNQSRAGGGSNPFMAITLRVPRSVKEPFLTKDISRIVTTHTNVMARAIGKRQGFEALGIGQGEDGVKVLAERLKREYEAVNEKLLAKPKSPENTKEILKLKKQYEQAKSLMENSFAVLDGTLGRGKSEGWRKFNKIMQQYTVMKALGGLPLLQIPETGSLLRQTSMGKLLTDNVFPMIQSAFKGGKFLYAQEDLAHAGLAINTHIAAAARAWEENIPMDLNRGWLSTTAQFMDAASSKFMNMTGSNPIQDAQQHLSGVIAQSKNIEAALLVAQGKSLSARQIERLHLNGLDLNRYGKDKSLGTMADRIKSQFEQFGQAEKFKAGEAYLANYSQWTDFEAKLAMTSAIRKEVNTIILTPNYLDVPFAFRTPVGKMLTMFLSYGYAASNARLMPLLQGGDLARVQAEMVTLALSAWVDPIRQALDGKEPDLSVKALMGSAWVNSGVFGFPMDYFAKINSQLDIPYLNAFRGDRFQGRDKSLATLLGGPVVGAAESFKNLTNDVLSGKITQGTFKSLLKSTIPGASTFYARPFVHYLAEQTGLPKTKREAEEWFPDSKNWLNALGIDD